MRPFPVFPATLVLIALAVAAFIFLPRADRGQFLLDPLVDAPHSAMPVAGDAPDSMDDAPEAAPMGNVDEALSAAPAPDASVMPAAPSPVTQQDKDRLGADRWALSWLGDESVPKGDRAPNIVFDVAEGRVSGYAGCNRYAGTFDLDGDILSFGPLAATRMACDQLALEGAYLGVLATVSGWSIDKTILFLKDGTGRDVARFIKP